MKEKRRPFSTNSSQAARPIPSSYLRPTPPPKFDTNIRPSRTHRQIFFATIFGWLINERKNIFGREKFFRKVANVQY